MPDETSSTQNTSAPSANAPSTNTPSDNGPSPAQDEKPPKEYDLSGPGAPEGTEFEALTLLAEELQNQSFQGFDVHHDLENNANGELSLAASILATRGQKASVIPRRGPNGHIAPDQDPWPWLDADLRHEYGPVREKIVAASLLLKDAARLIAEERGEVFPSKTTFTGLEVRRPIAFFDCEATGLDTDEARIFQISIMRLVPGGHEESSEDGFVNGREETFLINPGVEIPAEVEELTGITNADVADAPTFAEVASEIRSLMEDADLAGYNSNSYDVPLLTAEFDRIGERLPGPQDQEYIDVLTFEKVLYSMKLEAVYERRTGQSMQNAHHAKADVQATIEIFETQVRTSGFEGTIPELAQAIRGDYLDNNRKLKILAEPASRETVVFDFGKHTGQTVEWVETNDPGYLRWATDNVDGLQQALARI